MRPIRKTLSAVLIGILLVPTAAPAALAGPAEIKFLERLAGTWKGSGRITGAEGGKVSCRLTFRPSGERLNFNGRCAMSGGSGSQSFSGSIRYNDRRGVYESSSSGRTVAGKKSGSSLVFTTAQKDMRGSGTSTMTLSANAIRVQFQLVNSRTGEKSQGSIPFSRG